ncbi:MAG: 4-hydroxy-tetrahydrodipicolinate synthase [Clostridia bacterium]|nr:4-hydroxy-tetrahydrodipicolinate synthase [Clostridia bacterium]
MKKCVFKGSGVALITPFKDGHVDFEKFGDLIEFHIANKTDALIICGTTGESATMPDSEHIETIKFAVQKVAGRIPVIGGAGSNDTAHGVKLAKAVADAGVDALLLVTPYYNKCTQKGLIAHYKMMAEAVSVPCILYNVPGRTGVNIAPQTVYELSKVENIVGVKEASGKVEAAIEIAKLCGDDFAIYSGNDDINVPLMSIGAIGTISVLANVVPEDTHNMCKACLDGDYVTARELQKKYFDLINLLFIEVNPIPVKAAMNLLGMCGTEIRMPLSVMEDNNLELLKKEMKALNLIKD